MSNEEYNEYNATVGDTTESSSWTDEQEHSATGDQSETSESSEDSSTESERTNGIQKRFNKLTARAKQAERRAQAAEEKLRQHGLHEEPGEQSVGNDAPNEYPSDPGPSEAEQHLRDNFQRSAQQSRSKYADFDQVVSNSPVTLPDPALVALGELENVADVAYHLAKNPQLAEKLWGMTPIQSVAELGRISARLERQAEAPILRPPKPPTPISKSSPSVNTGLSDDLDIKDWVKRRDRELTRR